MKGNWVVHPIRVRYQETDQMGVVFHVNYATWFEIGRTEWIRHLGYSYRGIEEKGLLFPVIELNCKYIAPAKYDDTVLICTRIIEHSPLRISFESQVRKVEHDDFKAALFSPDEVLPGQLLVSGGTKHVWVNEQWHPIRLNKVLPDLYEKLQKG